jgi:hypothetical protein
MRLKADSVCGIEHDRGSPISPDHEVLTCTFEGCLGRCLWVWRWCTWWCTPLGGAHLRRNLSPLNLAGFLARSERGFTKKGGRSVCGGIEKQVVGSAYLREGGHELTHASFRHSARPWPGKPIRFAAQATYINELYTGDFSAHSGLSDQVQHFCFKFTGWKRQPCDCLFPSSRQSLIS